MHFSVVQIWPSSQGLSSATALNSHLPVFRLQLSVVHLLLSLHCVSEVHFGAQTLSMSAQQSLYCLQAESHWHFQAALYLVHLPLQDWSAGSPQPGTSAYLHTPEVGSQLSVVHSSPSSQSFVLAAVHLPALQASPSVQMLPSSQAPSFASLVQPLAVQASVVQGSWSSHSLSSGSLTHLPAPLSQLSLVQAWPSSHRAPLSASPSQSLSTPSQVSAAGALASQAASEPSALQTTLPAHFLPSFSNQQAEVAPWSMAQALQVQVPALGTHCLTSLPSTSLPSAQS